MYSIQRTDLDQLENASWTEANLAGGNVTIHIPRQPQEEFWPRRGSEAYCMLAECHHPQRGTISSVLKIFIEEISERVRRMEYLSKLGLARQHAWAFQGVPYGLIDRSVGGLRIVGHIAQRIGGESEDIGRLRDQGRWQFSEDDRRRFCGHLCFAVEVLERLGLVHGDISAGNVMIGVTSDGPAAILCDFDGFFHPSQPLVPPKFRPRGSSGYQYPAFLETFKQNPDAAYIATDRFALAAMICEIMCWTSSDAAQFDREELLTDDLIAQRNIKGLEGSVTARWRQGFGLLEAALAAKSERGMPSPGQWMTTLGLKGSSIDIDAETPFKNRPRVAVRRRPGGFQTKQVAEVRLQSDEGDLKSVNSALKEVRFSIKGGCLRLEFRWNAQLLLRRRGDVHDLGNGPLELVIQDADVVISNGWELEIRDLP